MIHMLTAWLVMLRLILCIFIGISIVRINTQGILPLKKQNGSGVAKMEYEKAA